MAAIRWGFAAIAMAMAVAPAFAGAPTAQVGRVSFHEESPTGEHAIQLFDAQGKLVRDLDLAQFLPKDYVAALPSDATGLHWRRETKLAKDAVEFEVAVPGEQGPALHFSIDLRDGLVRTAQIREYLAATDRARATAAHPLAVAEASPASP